MNTHSNAPSVPSTHSTTTGAATIDRPGPRAARQTTVARHIQRGDVVRFGPSEFDPYRSGTVAVTAIEVEYDPYRPERDSVWVHGTYTVRHDITGETHVHAGLGEFDADEVVRIINAV